MTADGMDDLPEGAQSIVRGFDSARPAPIDDDGHDDVPPPEPPREDFGGEPLPPCPVTPLGVGDDGRRYYVTPRGRIDALAANAHQKLSLVGLFDGDTSWLVDAFPSRDKDGNVTGWQAMSVACWLMAQCAERGGFDPMLMMRGHGSWPPVRDDPARGLIVHCGDKLIVDGAALLPGPFGRRIYPSKRPLPAPADVPLTADEGKAILAHIESRWAWEDPDTMPRLALGTIGAGALPAALEVRPVIHVAGARGTGKTTFLWFVGEMLGDWALSLADTTPAAVRQLLSGSALMVLIDELEGGELYERAREIVRIARLAWSDKSGRSARGTLSGKAELTALDAMFLFSSIIRPPLPPADVDRFVMLEVAKHSLPPLGWERIVPDCKELARLGPKLHRRMIDTWPLLKPLIARLQEALTVRGHTGRSPVNLATLLACAELLTGTGDLDAADVDAICAPFDPVALADRAGDDPGWRLCLDRLLTSMHPAWRGGDHPSIGRLACEALAGDKTAHDRLKDVGLKVHKHPDSGERFLGVAVAHAQLDALFGATDWARGGWVADLKQVPGAWRPDGPIRFVRNLRAICVPVAMLDLDGVDEPLPDF